ncbi:hypothetical protein KSC_109300 [Ktedonobacter sp. SOSP1-52]|uniref:DUF4097 family beta strand repeat-containing protein n=1 Tax=Ktedonobacter sp. SOSP1-52 TaxID=2778366 RepID=UPI0019165722|nr:DUF4097 family beta strand repeat-containing protein [Ktedonobacter sp. SOSP1-52]GHO72038.1 hypothetical protein KSC_109300 [Ktedonobacter sp. SOSP1-52]
MQSEQQFDERRKDNRDPREQVPDAYGYRESKADYIQPPQRPQKRGSRFLGVLLVLLLLLGAGSLFGGHMLSSNTSGTLPAHTFTLTGKDSLRVISTHGDVHIHQGNTNTVVVTATKHTPILGNLGDNLKVDYTQNGNAITVQVEGNSSGFLFNSASIDLDITIPTTSDVDINDASGDITVSDITGQVKAETGSGDIEVTNVEGTTTLKTGSGDIQASGISGTADIQSGSGDVDLEDAHLQGKSVLHTGSGDIRFDGSLNANGDYTLESGSGDIDVTLPADSALQFSLHSGHADIKNDFDTESVGNGPRAPVSIRTGSGDINIHKR